jgi:small subunit ribosomal protein S5
MAENAQPKVINKSGTLRMTDETAKVKTETDISGRPMDRGRGRRRDAAAKTDLVPKEFEEVTISIDRVARVVAGGRRFRFKALVAVGNRKDKVGIGIAKGTDVTAAVTKATARAKKNMIKVNLNGDTIYHEVETKVTGAKVLLKPAAPGTGIIAGGVVRSIIALTGIKSLISKSLGSTNKVNIAYATIEGLRAQVPRSEWHTTEKKAAKPAKAPAKKSEDK